MGEESQRELKEGHSPSPCAVVKGEEGEPEAGNAEETATEAEEVASAAAKFS